MPSTLQKILQTIIGGASSYQTPPFIDPGMSAPSPTLPTGVVGNNGISNVSGGNEDYSSPAFDLLLDRIVNAPKREDYKPSILRKIGASIATVGSGRPSAVVGGQPVGYESNPNAAKIADSLVNKPYYDAMGDFESKLKPLEVAANTERMNNTQLRIAKGQERTSELAATREERLAKEGADRVRIQQAKLELERLKAAKKNLKMYDVAGGNIMVFDPDTGKISDSGIESGKMSDVEKMNLGLENAKSIEDVRQINRESLAKLTSGLTSGRNAETQDRIDDRTEYTQGQINSRSGGDGQTPSQQFTARRNKAIDLINQHPEYIEFFETDSNGTPTGVMKEKPSSVLGFGADKAKKYDEARALFIPKLIKVKRKSDGQGGEIPEENFDPVKYDKVQ